MGRDYDLSLFVGFKRSDENDGIIEEYYQSHMDEVELSANGEYIMFSRSRYRLSFGRLYNYVKSFMGIEKNPWTGTKIIPNEKYKGGFGLSEEEEDFLDSLGLDEDDLVYLENGCIC